MTKKEARDVLQEQIDKYGQEYDEDGIEALKVAIEVLEQEPSKDCISRHEVIKIIENKLNPCTDMFKCLEMSEIKDDVEHLPSVTPQPKTEWIPVSERLPKHDGWYLISLGEKTYGGADIDMYCKGWVKYGTHVIAWMPLPTPYEESEDKE